MTTEDRDARLTAYALDDRGLTAADRQAVEALCATDPAARQAVDETRHLARVLTDALTAEQAAPADEPVTIPAVATPRPARGWTRYVVAAAVLIAVGGGSLLAWTKWKADRGERVAMAPVPVAANEDGRRDRDRSEKRFDQAVMDPAERAGYGDVDNLPGRSSTPPPRPVATSPDESKKGGKADKPGAGAIPGDTAPRADLPSNGDGKVRGPDGPVPGPGGPAGYGPGGLPPGSGGRPTQTGPARPGMGGLGGGPAPGTPSPLPGIPVGPGGPPAPQPNAKPEPAVSRAMAARRPRVRGPAGGATRPANQARPRRDAEPATEGRPGEGEKGEKGKRRRTPCPVPGQPGERPHQQ